MPGRGGTRGIICTRSFRPDGIEWSWALVSEPYNSRSTLMFMIKNCKLNLLDELTCDPSVCVGETDFPHLRTPANSLFISFSVK
jgi:hypothetical protein